MANASSQAPETFCSTLQGAPKFSEKENGTGVSAPLGERKEWKRPWKLLHFGGGFRARRKCGMEKTMVATTGSRDMI